MKTILTHNGSYHNDELFACALYSYFLDIQHIPHEIVRTRDEEQIKKADIVIDVGGEYDATRLRFDHHQTTFMRLHDKSAIPMASLGIVFEYVLSEIRKHNLLGDDTKFINDEAVYKVVQNYVRPIDAHDNGMDLLKREKNTVYPIDLEMFLMTFKYERGSDKNFQNEDEPFYFLIPIIKMFWSRTFSGIIRRERDYLDVLDIIDKQPGDTVLIPATLNPKRAVEERERVKFYIQERDDNSYNVSCAFIKYEKFKRRALFPESWRGLREGEFGTHVGISGAKFCHKGGYFAIVNTEEEAWELVKKAKVELGMK